MNENDLRDCFAMFALVGLSMREQPPSGVLIPDLAYQIADGMLEVRKKEPEEGGITTIKKRVRKS